VEKGNRDFQTAKSYKTRKEQKVMKKKNKQVKRNWSKWIEPDVFSFIRKNKSL
jgi:hypothetical protein